MLITKTCKIHTTLHCRPLSGSCVLKAVPLKTCSACSCHYNKVLKDTTNMRREEKGWYLGRYDKHLGMLPTKKLYEKSATLN